MKASGWFLFIGTILAVTFVPNLSGWTIHDSLIAVAFIIVAGIWIRG